MLVLTYLRVAKLQYERTYCPKNAKNFCVCNELNCFSNVIKPTMNAIASTPPFRRATVGCNTAAIRCVVELDQQEAVQVANIVNDCSSTHIPNCLLYENLGICEMTNKNINNGK
jgi:hypothetical protein